MPDNGRPDDFRLGFYTAIQTEHGGYVGGLLVTNRFGRPLEFQCTTPVQANPTQEILFGPTLLPYVLGELIGRTLVEKATVKPQLILTDQSDAAEVRNFTDIPVACLDTIEVEIQADSSSQAPDVQIAPEATLPAAMSRTEEQHSPSDPSPTATVSIPTTSVIATGETLSIGKQRFRVHPAHTADALFVGSHAGLVPRDADLGEPFQRVRDALHETLRMGTSR